MLTFKVVSLFFFLAKIRCETLDGQCALIQSAVTSFRGAAVAGEVELQTSALSMMGSFQAYLATLSAEQLTAETVCDLRTLKDELAGTTCTEMPDSVMIHIPKTAGTAVELAGITSGMRWGCHMSFHGCSRGGTNCYPWHVPPSWMATTLEPNLYEGRDTFCVVRNPYDRALSEYRYFNDDCNKNSMNDKLKEWLEDYKRGNIVLNGCHLVPQAEYVWGRDGRQWCQTMLRLEEFPTAFDNYMASRNLTSVQLRESPVNLGHCQDLSVDDIDPSNIKLINDIYHEDFERLNYPR
eukprot:CAMPEP_0178433340 /NCGR_PEP_ID=MMETSP0689_2-20121128/32853_1 /TAXON_ID=160604 /ORGANISM="Amphidinium massartii, Strain CS-259" /LENGTH=293 /DNA_ID=CAMNT_0020055361 /DNA_START=67 /DNA_END=945 /DNA_ORIENTATION=+